MFVKSDLTKQSLMATKGKSFHRAATAHLLMMETKTNIKIIAAHS
jgi:hypothetical protein